MNHSGYNSHKPWDYDYIEKRILDAISVITIGVLLLLNTTGTLPWSIWFNLMKLWPLLVISIGVQLIFSWSRLSRFIGTFISTLIFLGAIVIAISPQVSNLNLNIFNLVGNEQNIVTAENVISISSLNEMRVEDMEVNVDMSIGSVEITEDTDVEYVETASKYSSNLTEPALSYEIDGDTLKVDFKDVPKKNFNLGSNHSEHIVKLGTTVLEKTLNIKVGAGNGILNLDETIISSLNAEVGAGNLEIDMNDTTLENINSIRLKVGLGNVTFKLNRDFGYKINYEVGLGNLSIDGNDVEGAFGKDGTFMTDNYDSAERKAEINVEVGLGNAEFIY
jgi:hypothetical protein